MMLRLHALGCVHLLLCALASGVTANGSSEGFHDKYAHDLGGKPRLQYDGRVSGIANNPYFLVSRKDPSKCLTQNVDGITVSMATIDSPTNTRQVWTPVLEGALYLLINQNSSHGLTSVDNVAVVDENGQGNIWMVYASGEQFSPILQSESFHALTWAESNVTTQVWQSSTNQYWRFIPISNTGTPPPPPSSSPPPPPPTSSPPPPVVTSPPPPPPPPTPSPPPPSTASPPPPPPHSAAQQGYLATYWGQNGNEGSLTEACQTQQYDIIMISFLYVFGEGRVPQLNLAGHCGDWNPCTFLTSQIELCQSLGVKLLLSIGGAVGPYGLASDEDAGEVASYIWNNYLGGESTSRPLGSAVLDGVDFDIEGGNGREFYGTLAQAIRELSTTVTNRQTHPFSDSQIIKLPTDIIHQPSTYKTYYLSAAPQCVFPDYYLGPGSETALETGLFDYVFIQFYNNAPCQYNAATGDVSLLLSSWNTWTSSLPTNALVFLGLPASIDAAGSGFMPTNVLISDVLPVINSSRTYGGVMLWNRYFDLITGYGATIKPYI